MLMVKSDSTRVPKYLSSMRNTIIFLGFMVIDL